MTAGTAALPGGGLTLVSLATAGILALPVLLVFGALLGGGRAEGPASVPDIPAEYLALYRQAAEHYGLGVEGWSYLAAVGRVECDHGRSPLRGCQAGSNVAGARGPAQFLASTWETYGVDADGDGDRDVYDPADAIHGMANYLRASGAPRDWRRALFAYNHAGWYVERVVRQAAAYRAAAVGSSTVPGRLVGPGSTWLAPVPGFPGERCDARIVPDVVALVATFGIHVSDCYGGAPHDPDGEHPLGLAIDAGPADGDWRRTELLARRFGWREPCARAGCPGAGPFRVILYNGYPGHGDPQHSGRPHIHLSWQHGPASRGGRAPWVRVLLAPSSRPRRPR
jgi:hypothetical protein